MDWLPGGLSEWGLAGVGLSAFLSSTILPGSSEGAVIAYAALEPERLRALFWVATVMNCAGGMTTWAAGRLIRQPRSLPPRALWLLQKLGPAALLFSWAPVIGDALSLGAGIARCAFWPSLLFTALGKGARYAAILGAAGLFLE